ncbi:MAG: protein NO VEIN domain-containing protein [Desulfococcaceae bacterium]
MKGSTKHEFYDLLNLLGYGLAKFDLSFVEAFGFSTKQDFYKFFVKSGIVKTGSTVKNRQDLFDPFFDNGRKGWWQKGDSYIHRKLLIDSLFGDMDVFSFVDLVKLSLFEIGKYKPKVGTIKPALKSRFRQMQLTGVEAEFFFKAHYSRIVQFQYGTLEDVRLFGDGYDFQVETPDGLYLAEVKGVRQVFGGIRLTEKEFAKAREYGPNYGLVVVSNLIDRPKMTSIFDPLSEIKLAKEKLRVEQVFYRSDSMFW